MNIEEIKEYLLLVLKNAPGNESSEQYVMTMGIQHAKKALV